MQTATTTTPYSQLTQRQRNLRSIETTIKQIQPGDDVRIGAAHVQPSGDGNTIFVICPEPIYKKTCFRTAAAAARDVSRIVGSKGLYTALHNAEVVILRRNLVAEILLADPTLCPQAVSAYAETGGNVRLSLLLRAVRDVAPFRKHQSA